MKTSQPVKTAQKQLIGLIGPERAWYYPPLYKNYHQSGPSLTAIREARQILKNLEEDSIEWGVELAKTTYGDWHKPN